MRSVRLLPVMRSFVFAQMFRFAFSAKFNAAPPAICYLVAGYNLETARAFFVLKSELVLKRLRFAAVDRTRHLTASKFYFNLAHLFLRTRNLTIYCSELRAARL